MQTKKIPNTSELVKKTDYPDKITGIKGKIPSIIGLADNSALTAVQNKILDVSNLVQIDYNAKISKIEKRVTNHNHDKYIATPEINNLTEKSFAAKLV